MFNRYLLGVMFAMAALSVGVTFFKFFVARDYLVVAVTECDPNSEICFVGDGESTPEFYKIVSKPAYSIPACNAWAGECGPLTCAPDEEMCKEIVCDSRVGDMCSSETEL